MIDRTDRYENAMGDLDAAQGVHPNMQGYHVLSKAYRNAMRRVADDSDIHEKKLQRTGATVGALAGGGAGALGALGLAKNKGMSVALGGLAGLSTGGGTGNALMGGLLSHKLGKNKRVALALGGLAGLAGGAGIGSLLGKAKSNADVKDAVRFMTANPQDRQEEVQEKFRDIANKYYG